MFEKGLDFFISYMALPMFLTERSPNRWLRVFGAILAFPWFLAQVFIAPLILVFVIVCLLGTIIQGAWKGN